MTGTGTARFIPCTTPGRLCGVYMCRQVATLWLGRPDGPRSLWQPFCDECAASAIASAPVRLTRPAALTDPAEPDPIDEGDFDGAFAEPERHACPRCGSEFARKAQLRGHMAVHARQDLRQEA